MLCFFPKLKRRIDKILNFLALKPAKMIPLPQKRLNPKIINVFAVVPRLMKIIVRVNNFLKIEKNCSQDRTARNIK